MQLIMENSGSMKKELDKVYSPTEIEDRWYKIWEENGYFSAQHNEEKPGYSIVIPPPNVTGILHMGHMLDNTIQDAIIRYKRMSGFDTLWEWITQELPLRTKLRECLRNRELQKKKSEERNS